MVQKPGQEAGGGTLGFQDHLPFNYLDPQTGPAWILLVVSWNTGHNSMELRIQLLERWFFNCLQDLWPLSICSGIASTWLLVMRMERFWSWTSRICSFSRDFYFMSLPCLNFEFYALKNALLALAIHTIQLIGFLHQICSANLSLAVMGLICRTFTPSYLGAIEGKPEHCFCMGKQIMN